MSAPPCPQPASGGGYQGNCAVCGRVDGLWAPAWDVYLCMDCRERRTETALWETALWETREQHR